MRKVLSFAYERFASICGVIFIVAGIVVLAFFTSSVPDQHPFKINAPERISNENFHLSDSYNIVYGHSFETIPANTLCRFEGNRRTWAAFGCVWKNENESDSEFSHSYTKIKIDLPATAEIEDWRFDHDLISMVPEKRDWFIYNILYVMLSIIFFVIAWFILKSESDERYYAY